MIFNASINFAERLQKYLNFMLYINFLQNISLQQMSHNSYIYIYFFRLISNLMNIIRII